MTKCDLITQSSTKRVTAAALAEAKTRRNWSNSDAGDAIGCAEGTVRNRLDADDPKNQMTVHELRRSLQADGAHIANAIMADVEYRVVSTACSSAPEALSIAGDSARCAAEIITAAPDGFDRDEAKRLLPIVTAQINQLAALETLLRQVIANT